MNHIALLILSLTSLIVSLDSWHNVTGHWNPFWREEKVWNGPDLVRPLCSQVPMRNGYFICLESNLYELRNVHMMVGQVEHEENWK